MTESVIKSAPEGELTDARKQELLDRANDGIERATGEKDHFADFDELCGEYGALLLGKLPEEAEKLPTDLSAGEIIAEVLTERGEAEVTADNAGAVTERLEAEGLDSDYGRYINKDDIAKAYDEILEVTFTSSDYTNADADGLMFDLVCGISEEAQGSTAGKTTVKVSKGSDIIGIGDQAGILWDEASNAKSYDITVKDSEGNTVQIKTGITGLSYALDGFAKEGVYTVGITSINTAGKTEGVSADITVKPDVKVRTSISRLTAPTTSLQQR